MSPRRATHFSLLRQRKVSKRKAPLLCVTPTLRVGATCDARSRGVPRNSLRACGAPFKQTRQVRPRSMRVLRHACHPAPCASRHAQKGTRGSDSHPGHRCARPGLRGAKRLRRSGPSAAMARVDVRLSNPLWLRLRRGDCGVACAAGHTLRELARRGCPSEAPRARSEFHGAPRKRPAAGLPRSAAKGSQTWGRFLFGDFLLARQEKVTAPPGAHPGLRPQHGHAASFPTT